MGGTEGWQRGLGLKGRRIGEGGREGGRGNGSEKMREGGVTTVVVAVVVVVVVSSGLVPAWGVVGGGQGNRSVSGKLASALSTSAPTES